MSRQNWDRRAKERQLLRRISEGPVSRSSADWAGPRAVAGWRVEYPERFPVTTNPAPKETTMNELRACDYNGFTPAEDPQVPEAFWADTSEVHCADLSEVHFADLSGERAA